MSHTITELITLETQVCCACGITFAMPSHYVSKLRESKNNFYCPNGHTLAFQESAKDREIARLKEEKDQAERSRMYLHNQLTEKAQDIAKLQRQIKTRNRRIAAGVCPCCNRTVKQLAEHMKTMHPEVINAPKVPALHKKISSK